MNQSSLSVFRKTKRFLFRLCPDAITYACILKACGITQDVDMGKRVHDEIANQGQQALGCFQRMRSEGISPDAITYACILKACGITQDADMGKRVHDEIANQGLLRHDIVLGTALVDMYAKCDVLQNAQKVLDELLVRDVTSWNALIAGYTTQGKGQEALSCFQRMRSEGISPDAITYACILKVCGTMQDAEMGKKIHTDIASQGLLEKEVVLGNVLVDMYAKCGVLQNAQKVLNKLPIRDVVSWSVLIAGYAEQGQSQEALGCFQRMQSEGIPPDEVTYAYILKAMLTS